MTFYVTLRRQASTSARQLAMTIGSTLILDVIVRGVLGDLGILNHWLFRAGVVVDLVKWLWLADGEGSMVAA